MINLLKGGCLEVMKSIEDNSIDAIITDPPYGTTACKWDSVIDFELMWKQLNRIIKPNGAIVLFGNQPFTSALIMSNPKMFKYCWAWNKKQSTGFLNAKKQPLRVIEDVCVFYKKQPNYNPIMETRGKPRNKDSYNKEGGSENYGTFHNTKAFNNIYYPTNLLEISNAKQKGKQHPTQKPIELMEYLIKTYTKENETVLDFTMGSGSTMVACKNLNRNGIGIEKEEKYFKIASKRIKENEYKLF